MNYNYIVHVPLTSPTSPDTAWPAQFSPSNPLFFEQRLQPRRHQPQVMGTRRRLAAPTQHLATGSTEPPWKTWKKHMIPGKARNRNMCKGPPEIVLCQIGLQKWQKWYSHSHKIRNHADSRVVVMVGARKSSNCRGPFCFCRRTKPQPNCQNLRSSGEDQVGGIQWSVANHL